MILGKNLEFAGNHYGEQQESRKIVKEGQKKKSMNQLFILCKKSVNN